MTNPIFVVVDLISTCNYAINFFIYTFASSTFRKELRDLFACLSPIRCWPSATTAVALTTGSANQIEAREQEIVFTVEGETSFQSTKF